MTNLARITQNYEAHLNVFRDSKEILNSISQAVDLIVSTLKENHKILLAGNGGSAADAQHWAAEWVVRLSHHLNRPALPAIALSTDTSIITACANDLSFNDIFSRQVEALAENNDLFIGISTSGNSGNIISAVKAAHDKGAKTLGILGNNGGKIAELCDLSVIVPSSDTQRIQEVHSFIGHQLCELSELNLFS